LKAPISEPLRERAWELIEFGSGASRYAKDGSWQITAGMWLQVSQGPDILLLS